MKKWILWGVFFVFCNQSAFSTQYICQQKCFQHCKLRQQAVKDCKMHNETSVSFQITCQCRALKSGEILPPFFQKTRIIKTSAS